MQGVSEAIKRVLAQVGIGEAVKSHCMMSFFSQTQGSYCGVYKKVGLCMKFHVMIQVHIGETGRSLKTRNREHFDAVIRY